MGLEVDVDNRIWAFGSTGEVGGMHPFQVFNRSGEVIGRGELSHIPFALDKNHAYIVVANEKGLLLRQVAISF